LRLTKHFAPLETLYSKGKARSKKSANSGFFVRFEEIDSQGRTVSADSENDMTLRELDYRTGDQIEVSLLWSPESGQLAVVVIDEAAGEEFAMEVEPEEALEVFRHPFAYADRRQLEFRRPLISQAA
jgi:hypothetical protein